MAQEVSCKIIRTVLEFAREVHGDSALSEIAAVAQVDLTVLEDEDAWIDHDAEKKIFRALDQIVARENAAYQSGEFGMRAGSFGSLETFVRAMLRPRNVYQRIPYLANRLAKVGTMSLDDLKHNRARLRYEYSPGYESIIEICDNRRGMLAGIPTLWGLPPAEVEELRCSARGADCCEYEVRWIEPVGHRMTIALGGLGALLAVGLLLGVLFGELPFLWSGPLGLGAPVLGLIIGRLLDSRRELRATREVIRQQNQELSTQLERLEAQVDETARLNAHLEDLVLERTGQLEHELSRLRRLNDLSRDIGGTLITDEIIQLSMRGLSELVPNEGCGLFPAPVLEDLRPSLRGVDVSLQPRAMAFMRAADPWGVEAIDDDHWVLWLNLQSGAQSDDALGVLALQRSASQVEAFSERDVEIGRAFAEIVVASLANARLFNETERLSITDSLTGLFVRRHFHDALVQVTQRARRSKEHGAALLIMDIDDFKSINDTFGHPTGDVVIQTVAEQIRQALDATDVAARYGGEEFAVIMPNAEGGRAAEVAEQIRVAVSSTRMPTSRGDEITVTLSTGYALWREDDDAETWLAAADSALYAAKAAGKNKVKARADR